MPLFPESEKWVCTSLINPTTNEIRTNKISVINRYITLYTNKNLKDYTFDEFVNLLNNILSGQQIETEETRRFKEEIITTFFTRMFGIPYTNDWDLCGILLVMKKMIDEKLTTCENSIKFIENTISLLTPVTNIVDEEFDLFSTYFPKNFTYSDIEDDKFMNDFFDYFYEHLYDEDPEINIIDLLRYPNNSDYPAFLLLNENFRQKIYQAIEEVEFNDLINIYKLDINFIRTLITYQPLALRFVGDIWRNNREIVILAVSNDGMALEFASTEFGSDREIVLLSVKNNAKSLIFASDEIIVAAANSIIDGIV
jgi:hypothetical protein